MDLEEEKTNRDNSGDSVVDAVQLMPKKRFRRASRMLEISDQRKIQLLEAEQVRINYVNR